MAQDDFRFALGDRDLYAPIEEAPDPGTLFETTGAPQGWTRVRRGIWTGWDAPGPEVPEQGWKIHVSARLDRAQSVLDTVAGICFAEATSFKHLGAELFFLYLHHKHGPRPQAGKFIAAYPADEATARRLLDRLADALADEDGPYVLTDRRYRDSRTVHYRYGSFLGRSRLRADGSVQGLIRDGRGEDTPDLREPAFHLPAGITDPFAQAAAADDGNGDAVVHGYEFRRVLQQSNAGGAYEAREVATGRTVFIKEARAHNGLNWDGSDAQTRLRHEHEVLRTLHAAAPGLCPEPVDYFREWEHEFLVTEFVTGKPLGKWTARNDPALWSGTESEHAEYYRGCRTILDGVAAALDRLHALGHRFGDLNPGNVLVGDDLSVRLIDFEAATTVDRPDSRLGAPGYMPPRPRPDLGPFHTDDYALAAVALCLLTPMHAVFARAPGNVRLARHDLERVAPVPEDLWRLATRFVPEARDDRLPSPADADADPGGAVDRLIDLTRAGLLDLLDPAHPTRMTPTVAKGLTTNRLSFMYGSAGVVHALGLTGAIPDDVLARFRADAVASFRELPPGLHTGAAGVALVLARTGFTDEALDVLAHADDHPLTLLSTTLGAGVAGVGLAHLAMHRLTGDAVHLDRAAAAAEAIAGTPDLTPTIGERNAHGLLHGRAGLALFLHHAASATGDRRYAALGRELVHAELDRAMDGAGGAMSFPDDERAWRKMPYLYSGSAGMLTVLTRYATGDPDERCTAALPRVRADLTSVATAYGGLYCGLAGLAYAVADHADHVAATDPGAAARLRAEALRQAASVAKYAVPRGPGVSYIGYGRLRMSAELWSGNAGVLLALHRIRHGDDGGLLGPDATRFDAPAPATRT